MPKISLTRNQIIIAGSVLLAIVVVAVLFILGGHKGSTAVPVTLTVWGTEPQDAWRPVIGGYQALRPNATVIYKQVSADSYDTTVLNALAAGKGPDVFLIGNHDLLKRIDLLASTTQVTPADLKATFAPAAAQDLTFGGTVYALPLYMDTLALAYNTKLFDQAGIATPPKTWQDVLDDVARLRVEDANGQISQAAIALGGSEKSVDHATDIVNLLMLQNGTTMAEADASPAFGRSPGPAAFRFYLQFADSGNPAYTWNDAQQRSLESFAAQKTAMTFVYQSDLASIRAKSPFLDFSVTGAPQTGNGDAVNYPSYRALAVWIGSPQPLWAWDFAYFAATDPASQEAYLSYTGHPAALRSEIAKEENDQNLALFARAALTSRSWPMGDYDKIKEIFSTAIQNVQSGAKTPDAALNDAETQAAQLIRR